jgi:hypothetical protein
MVVLIVVAESGRMRLPEASRSAVPASSARRRSSAWATL